MKNNSFVVTNLRIDKNDWLAVRALAAEEGLSANEYLATLINQVTTSIILGRRDTSTQIGRLPKRSLLEVITNLRNQHSKKSTDGLSSEDEEIYR